jgi:hypothetical protein
MSTVQTIVCHFVILFCSLEAKCLLIFSQICLAFVCSTFMHDFKGLLYVKVDILRYCLEEMTDSVLLPESTSFAVDCCRNIICVHLF